MAVRIYAHVDDLELFGGPFVSAAHRTFIAASPMRQDHHEVMERQNLRKAACWGITTEYAWTHWYLDPVIREPIFSTTNIRDKVLRVMEDSIRYYGQTIFVTHNPWGEYGHIHHRRVSDAVCEIAQARSVTVQSTASVVRFDPDIWGMDTCGLPSHHDRYMRDDFLQRRDAYRDVEGRMPSNLWTWKDGFPPPEDQEVITLVDKGTDLRNDRVRALKTEIPVYGLPE